MLHEFLTCHRDDIIARCESRYRARNPDWSREDLLSTIPAFVDEIIRAERREAGLPEESTLPGDTVEARVQGQQRFDKGMRIRDVASDYAAISQAVGEIAIEYGIELDPRSYKVLNECIDAGIAAAITTYFDLSVERGQQQAAESLGFLAHELRNALASAMLAYSFIRTGQVGQHSRTARVLERSFNQLECLVQQMLAAVQLGSGVAPVRERVVLADLIDDLHAGALDERDIHVDLCIEDGLSVVADPRLLGSAISNLLQNALKFTRAGGRIQVRARRDGSEVHIEVEDECGGLEVPPESLFRSFVQAGRDHRGIGLGLSIARKAVEVHRGTLGARDLPGRGCVFTIALPAT